MPEKKEKVLQPVWPDELPWICRFGGPDFSTVPKPHIRFFPHPKGLVRKVEIRIESFKGVSVGARHYYVKFDEDANPVWDGCPRQSYSNGRRWVIPRDDHEYFKGGTIFDRELHCLTYKEAKARAEKIVKEVYKHWNVVWNTTWLEMKKWAYRMGD